MRLSKKDRIKTLDIMLYYVDTQLDLHLETFAELKPKIPFPCWLARQIHYEMDDWGSGTSFTPQEIMKLQRGMVDYANFVEYNWEKIKGTWLEATPQDKGETTWHHWPLVLYSFIHKI